MLKPFQSFCLGLSLCIALSSNAQDDQPIRINQLGYYPYAPKLAVVVGAGERLPFFITSVNTKDTLYRGQLEAQQASANSSLVTRKADFSKFQKPGKYILSIPGTGTSFLFEIKEQVLAPLALSVLKGFYFIRSDYPLQKAFAGVWSRPAGHPDTVVLIHPSAASFERPAGKVISTPGGWYDAGDYNKYIVNSGITMGTLLSAYEDFPEYYRTLKTDIPESKDSIPDLLNEVIYNLRWMLTMQDPNDGGVYHKCTNAAFDGMVMPGVTKLPRYVVQKSTAATLDFAAVIAQSARIFSRFTTQLPRLADSCRKASQLAWQWAMKNPNIIYDQRQLNVQFDPDVTTGDYGDRRLTDEWLWAAAEMFITWKDPSYFEVVLKNSKYGGSLPSWGNVGTLAFYSVIRNEKELPQSAGTLLQSMKDSIVQLADRYVSSISSNAFGSVMGQSKKDFIWGSNAVAANQGVLLINAYKITKKQSYLLAALTNLDYLTGRNATGYCFITGIGQKRVMHPHHRPSVADGIVEPVPGLLSGGPNPGRQDKCNYSYTEPETTFLDSDCSYASNEIAINWNAPIVYLANAIEALQKELHP